MDDRFICFTNSNICTNSVPSRVLDPWDVLNCTKSPALRKVGRDRCIIRVPVQ